MNALAWDHNAYYHRLLLRHLLRPCNRVLDVGCGAGAFAVELADSGKWFWPHLGNVIWLQRWRAGGVWQPVLAPP